MIGTWTLESFVVDGAQGAALEFLADEVAFALERFEVVVDPIGRADTHVLSNLAESGRVAPTFEGVGNEVECLLLAGGERLSHHERSPSRRPGAFWPR